MFLQLHEVQRPNPLAAQLRNDKKNSQRKTKVADAVDDKRLVPGDNIQWLFIPKTNQQIRTEAHPFPTDEERQQIVGHHQDQHEKNKKVEVDEKARHSLIVGHITEGIDVDKKSDAGDDKQHHRGEVIDLEEKLYLERAGLNKGKEGVRKNPRRGRDQKTVRADGKGGANRHTRQHSRTLFPQSSAEKYVEDRC